MNTLEELRKHFISKSKPFIDDYMDAASGAKELKGSGIARAAVWDLLADLIKQADDKTTFNIKGDDIVGKVDDILHKVSIGELTPEQGKKYMALVQSGFDMTELPKIMEIIEQSEGK